jgi:hypothetical protein
MPPGETPPTASPVDDAPLKEVRYSLPQLLRELQLERSASVFAREMLDQMEISQIFATRRKKHDKRRKQ